MSVNDSAVIDTSDMVCVHNALRRALQDAPAQLAAVSEDPDQILHYINYLNDVFWLARTHHDSEDKLLFPLIAERASQQRQLLTQINDQHHQLSSALTAAEQAAEQLAAIRSTAASQSLAAACRAFSVPLDRHLHDEEERVLPVAARTVSSAEWSTVPSHTISRYLGSRPWLPLGLMCEEMPIDVQDHMLSHMPSRVADMWFGDGAGAFETEILSIRSGG
jgi:hemerythrin-like domain-containing protein